VGAEFKILTHINGNCLHLKPMGTFDNVSAGQLVRLLRRHIEKVSTVIIHTSSMKEDGPIGQGDFKNEFLSLRKQPVRFVFTGEHTSLFC